MTHVSSFWRSEISGNRSWLRRLPQQFADRLFVMLYQTVHYLMLSEWEQHLEHHALQQEQPTDYTCGSRTAPCKGVVRVPSTDTDPHRPSPQSSTCTLRCYSTKTLIQTPSDHLQTTWADLVAFMRDMDKLECFSFQPPFFESSLLSTDSVISSKKCVSHDLSVNSFCL